MNESTIDGEQVTEAQTLRAALAELVNALREFGETGACCYQTTAEGDECGAPAHYVEHRRAGGRRLYCVDHVERRDDPRLVQQLPHGPALREAQLLLK